MHSFWQKDITGTTGKNLIKAYRLDNAMVLMLFPGSDTGAEIM